MFMPTKKFNTCEIANIYTGIYRDIQGYTGTHYINCMMLVVPNTEAAL